MDYKKRFPWEIPIEVEKYEALGIVTIETSILSYAPEINESYIDERVAGIVRYYSFQKLTKGFIPFAGGKVSLDILVKNDFLGEVDRLGLPIRGSVEYFFPKASFILSWPACQEITRKRGQEYRKKHPGLARKREWTSKGWIIHALAHELAHLIVGDEDLAMRNPPLSDIISEILAARYSWDQIKLGDGDVIPVPAGGYLKDSWIELGIDPNDSALCSRLFKEALEAHAKNDQG